MSYTEALPLALHIDRALKRYRRSVPIIAAVVVTSIFCLTVLIMAVRSDKLILQAIDTHVASLVAGQDRPELQRLLDSIAKRKTGAVLVIQEGQVLASSRSVTELDLPYQEPRLLQVASNSYLSLTGLVTQIPLGQMGGSGSTDAKIVMLTPLTALSFSSLAIALLILNFCLLIGNIIGEKLRKTITLALQPVGELDGAIRSLKALEELDALKSSGILELENIREAILETHADLVNTRDALAEKRARELATESYRRLIHDLHNPIAALGTLIKITQSTDLTEEERINTSKRIPLIAEQILGQVSAAKENLNFEAKILKEEDIRSCVKEAAEQAKLASLRGSSVVLNSNMPDEPVVLPHDARLLSRAIGNLVKNAVDACDGRVLVAIKRLANDISIQISDDGPGLSQAQAGLYLQGRGKSTKGDRHAHGLAATNHIIRSHGGKIIYRASEFGGACFEIRI